MATARNWIGGQHNLFDPNSWTPAGAPAGGDTVTIGLGSASNPNIATAQNAVLSGFQTVLDAGVGTPSSTTQPTLSLSNIIIASNASIEGTNTSDYPAIPGNTVAENINVNGLALNYGAIDDGIGKNVYFNTLNINLGNYTAFLNQARGTISAGDYGNLNIEGTNGPAVFVNNSTVSGAGSAIDIGTQVWGVGAFNLTSGQSYTSHSPKQSTLEFHQGVSTGQTVSLTNSELVLDSPMLFLGTIKDTQVGPQALQATNSEVLLSGETATSLSFQNNVLSVFDGSTVLAHLSFAPGLTANDFQLAPFGGNGGGHLGGTYIDIAMPFLTTQMVTLSVAPLQNQA